MWGFIDPAGRTVIRPRFAEVMPFRDGIAGVRTGSNQWISIDNQGAAGTGSFLFSDGLAAYQMSTGELSAFLLSSRRAWKFYHAHLRIAPSDFARGDAPELAGPPRRGCVDVIAFLDRVFWLTAGRRAHWKVPLAHTRITGRLFNARLVQSGKITSATGC